MKTSTKNRKEVQATVTRKATRAVRRREKLDSKIIIKSLGDLTADETAWLSSNSGGLIDAQGSLNIEAIRRSQDTPKQTAIYRIGGGSPVLLVVSQSDLTPGVVRDALEHLSKCQMRFEGFDAVAQMPASQVTALNASSLIVVFYEPLASCLESGTEAVIWNRSGFPDTALSTLAPHILRRVAESLKDDDVALIHDAADADAPSTDHQVSQEHQAQTTRATDSRLEENVERNDEGADSIDAPVQADDRYEDEEPTFAEDDMYGFTSTHPSPSPRAYDIDDRAEGEIRHQTRPYKGAVASPSISDSARPRSSRDML